MNLLVIIYIVAIIISIASMYVSKIKKADGNAKQTAIYLAAGGLGIQGVAFVMSLSFKKGFEIASLVILVADILFCVTGLLFHNNKLPRFISVRQKLITRLLVSCAIILLIEVFVCNFGSFSLLSPNAPQKQELSISEAIVDDMQYGEDTVCVQLGEYKTLNFNGIQNEVRTIYADLSVENDTNTTLDIGYTDESCSGELRYKAHLNYIAGDDSSKYITCSLFGKVDQLQFNVHSNEDSTVTLHHIVINDVIPFHFSWIRVGVFISIVFFIIILAYEPVMKKSCGSSKVFGGSCIIFTCVFLSLAAVLFLVRGSDTVVKLLSEPDMNQINKELVDAFSAGQVSLLDEPDSQLLALDNPYDDSLRKGIDFKWDHLFYNGKYYSYYGIGPVLTLFLPYHLITGKYFSSLWATFGYSLLGIMFLSLAYHAFMKRLFPKISNGIAIAGLVIVQSTSFIWYCITIGNFYELSQVSGFAFLMAGVYFLFRSNVFGERRISRISICIATTLLSLSVLCRAVMALYCIVSLLFIYAGVKKILRISENHTLKQNKKKVGSFLLAAFVPFVLIGSVQMIYNYLRFGSVFDFGISYTLTIYDYQHVQFHLPLTLIGFYNYLFTVPKVDSVFPFIKANYDSLSVNGYYFLASFSAVGLLWRALPVGGYAFGVKSYRIVKNEQSDNSYKTAVAIIILGCIIVPIIQIAMIWEYGYAARYAVDFAWEILFGAFVILFILYRTSSAPVRKMIYVLFGVSAVLSFMVNFSTTYEFVLDYADTYKQVPISIRSAMLSFGRLFEFWNIW